MEILNKIKAFECWIYCTVLKITWIDRVSNKEVLERMGMNMHLLSFLTRKY